MPEISGGGLVEGRRRDRNKLGEDAGEMVESIRKFKILGGILGGKTRDALGGFGVLVPKKKRLSVGRRRENARAGIEYLTTEFFDLHVARDLCAKRAECMG